MVYCIIWEMHGFPIKFPIALEKSVKPIKCVRPGELVYHTFSIKWVLFSLNSHPMIYTSSLCELYGFFHWMVNAWEIGSWENRTKLIICGESGKWVLILFPWYGCFFPITFTSCGILYNMWNTWVSPSISHSMGKCSKIHWIGRVWEIGTHFFPKVWYFSSIRFPSYGITLPHRKCMAFSINF